MTEKVRFMRARARRMREKARWLGSNPGACCVRDLADELDKMADDMETAAVQQIATPT